MIDSFEFRILMTSRENALLKWLLDCNSTVYQTNLAI